MMAVAVLVLCLLVGGAYTRNPNPGGFNVDNVVSCDGRPKRLPIQPRQPSQVWLPFSGRADIPELTRARQGILQQALGDDWDPRFSQPTRPSSAAEVHLQNAMFTPEVASSQLPDSSFNVSEQVVIRRWVSQALGCQINAEWTDLGPNFWPRWFTGRICSPIIMGGNCSVPYGGQVCHPDYRESDIVNVMNWDCCHDTQYRYMCGWRRVQFQLPRRCMCSCNPVPMQG